MKILLLILLVLLFSLSSHAQSFLGRRAHPVAVRVLYSDANTANAASYQTSAIASGPGRLLLCFCVTSDTVQPDNHSVTSLHGTWTQVDTNIWFDTLTVPLHKASLWYLYVTSNTSSTVTNKFANAATGGSFSIVELTGAAVYLAGGSITNRTINGANATANPNITLAATQGGANAVVASVGADVNGLSGTAETGWVEDVDLGHANPTTAIYTCHSINRSDGSVSITASSADWAGIAVEIRAQ